MRRVHTGANGMDVRRTDTELLVAREKGNYQETGLLGLFDILQFGEHVILQGDKGAGKTLNIEQWAFRNSVPFLRFGCTGETGDRDLLGGFVLKSLEESWFALGALSTAIDVANETGQCILALEEINALNEDAQKAVNSAADYRREVTIVNIGLVLRLNGPVFACVDGTIAEIEEEDEHTSSVRIGYTEHSVPTLSLLAHLTVGTEIKKGDIIGLPAKLWIIGTMNPGYGGTYELNEDFRSRFLFVTVSTMAAAIEARILYAQFPTAPSPAEQRFVKALQSLALETKGKKLQYALSTRDLEQCVKVYVLFSEAGDKEAEDKALKILEGKFPQTHVKDFQARVRSTFKSKINLSDTTLY